MGFFSNLFHKGGSKGGPKAAVPGSQPHRDWPWTLNLSGYPSSQIGWDIIAAELRELNLENNDSFLILEQKDPKGEYWYIQSALARMGPTQGQYTVGIGWSAPERNQMWEISVSDVERVIRYFDEAYHQYRVDTAGFEDQSDMLPGNS